MVRHGFSFIELLVSIVVIGIVFMSVPLLLSESEKSYAFSIQQEGIMAGITSMTNILGHHWDQADTNKTLNGGFAKVCDVSAGPADLNRTTFTSNRRQGHFKGNYRRKFFDYTYLLNATPDPLGIRPGITFATPPASLGPEPTDNGIQNDIDDFNGMGYGVTGSGIRDYKYDYDINISVYYINDAFVYNPLPAAQPVAVAISDTGTNRMTNIKMVRVTVTSDEGVINLYGFSSNIGEYKILHETFQ